MANRTIQKANESIYTDLDLEFAVHPVRKDIMTLKDELAIKRAVRNLVLTRPGEVPFHPEIGCGIGNMLFELMTPMTVIAIQRIIEDTIRNYEPRVRLHSVIVEPNYTDDGYVIKIAFWLLNKPDDLVGVGLFLKRLR